MDRPETLAEIVARYRKALTVSATPRAPGKAPTPPKSPVLESDPLPNKSRAPKPAPAPAPEAEAAPKPAEPAPAPAAPAAPAPAPAAAAPAKSPGFFGRLFARKPAAPGTPAPAKPATATIGQHQPAPPQPGTPEWHAYDYKQNGTRAEAFKSWFGDWEQAPHTASKVIHPETGEPLETQHLPVPPASAVTDKATGKPLVVYHGNPRGEVLEFKKEWLAKRPDSLHFGPGFYFTESGEAAHQYATGATGSAAAKAGQPGGVGSYYLKIHRPFDADVHKIDPSKLPKADRLSVRTALVQQALAEGGRSEALEVGRKFDAGEYAFKYQELTDTAGVGGFGASKSGIAQLLKELGYDGITVKGPPVDPKAAADSNRFWVAFEPHQVKGVRNQGTFDGSHPHVLKAIDTLPAPQAIALAVRLTGATGIRTRAHARATYLKAMGVAAPKPPAAPKAAPAPAPAPKAAPAPAPVAAPAPQPSSPNVAAAPTPAPAPKSPAAPKPVAPPTTEELENGTLGAHLHPNVHVRNVNGQDWVLKGRNGKRADVENESVASGLARSVGLNVPQVHAVKMYGQDHAAVEHVAGTPLVRMTPEERRAALANVPKDQIDKHALFDHLIGNADPNHGNYMVTPDGQFTAIDKEKSLSAGVGRSAAFRVPFFLEDAHPEPGKAAGDYEFHPDSVAEMATRGVEMAAKLRAAGRTADAEGVQRRAEVLANLAKLNRPVSATMINQAGHLYDRTSPTPGLVGRVAAMLGSKWKAFRGQAGYAGPAVQKAFDSRGKFKASSKPNPDQHALWSEEDHPRETEAHDGKKPGEFAPKDEAKPAGAESPRVGGMTPEEMATVAARNGHDYDEVLAKIRRKPGAWVQAVNDWKAAEDTEKKRQRQDVREKNWKPSEKQQAVLDRIGTGRRFPAYADEPMYAAHKAATQSLIKRGVLERTETPERVHYDVVRPPTPLPEFAPKTAAKVSATAYNTDAGGANTPVEDTKMGISLKWKKVSDGYEAEDARTSSSFAIVRERSKWRLLVDGDEYASPDSLANLKDVARTLVEDRASRVGISEEKPPKAKPVTIGGGIPAKKDHTDRYVPDLPANFVKRAGDYMTSNEHYWFKDLHDRWVEANEKRIDAKHRYDATPTHAESEAEPTVTRMGPGGMYEFENERAIGWHEAHELYETAKEEQKEIEKEYFPKVKDVLAKMKEGAR
jgi:hypothetical protein